MGWFHVAEMAAPSHQSIRVHVLFEGVPLGDISLHVLNLGFRDSHRRVETGIHFACRGCGLVKQGTNEFCFL
jgi:hypothetical protein